MKRYLPWMIVIGVLIAGATVWYLYGAMAAHTTNIQSVNVSTTPAGNPTPAERAS